MLEIGPVSVLRQKGWKASTKLGLLEEANLSHWTYSIVSTRKKETQSLDQTEYTFPYLIAWGGKQI
jgi:hypothetical protein